MGSTDGRIAIVTGARRGIGRDEALPPAAEGTRVVLSEPPAGRSPGILPMGLGS